MADEFLRASDGDREAAATLLREHLLAGRITMDEFEERLGAVYSAITLGDLGKLMDDLPIQTEQIDQDGPESRKERRRRKGSESKGKKAIAEWQERRDSQAHLLQFARYFRGEPAAPGFMCKPGETVFATVTSAALLEQRRLPGSYQGRSSGVSVPVGFGIRLRGGRSRGHYVPGPEALTDIDVGTLYITNKRVVFQGPKQTRESLFDKTVGISRDDQRGVAVISVSNRQRPMVIRYGPRVASDVAIRMELALAHFHGNLPTLIERLEHGLAEIDRNRPESAGSASALLPVSASDGPSRRMTGVSEKSANESSTKNDDRESEPPDRDVGWGVIYFASEVATGIATYELDYGRFVRGEKNPSRGVVQDLLGYMSSFLDEMASIIMVMEAAFADSSIAKAFGSDLLNGDEVALRNIARSLTDSYGELIALGLRARGLRVPAASTPAILALAELPRKPLEQIRAWSVQISLEGAAYVEDLRTGEIPAEPFNVTLTLGLDSDQVMAELRHLHGRP